MADNDMIVDIKEYNKLLHDVEEINGVLNRFSEIEMSTFRYFNDTKRCIENMEKDCHMSMRPATLCFEEALNIECTKLKEILFDTALKLINIKIKSALGKNEY